MSLYRFFTACLLFVSLLQSRYSPAQIQIRPHTSFHRATFGLTYGVLEGGTIDNGGLLTVFVQNTGTSADSIADIKVSKGGINATTLYTAWWPLELTPGSTTSIWIKGLASPFAENDTILIEITSTNGFSAQQSFINKTPGLRIANYMPEKDLSGLWLYLRNDEQTPVSVSTVTINDVVLVPGTPQLTWFGNTVINPGHIGIMKAAHPGLGLSALKPLRMVVSYETAGASKLVSAFERLVPAEFPVGTWCSPIANGSEEEGRKRLRRLSITSVFGPNNIGDMNANLPEYFMQVVREPDFMNNGVFTPAEGASYVAQNSNNNNFHYWLVDDEPDLNNKPIEEELTKNLAYWMNDTNTASFVNLASQKNYQRYGFYSDVISMDHYSDDGPPCVIPFPYWYTTEGSVREAIEYTVQLKRNTEPKRMNTWSQLISNAFSNQTEPFVVNFQFWAHVFSGAKGIYFFTAKPNHVDDNPSLWQESEKLVHELNGIKNLCLYSEPWEGVSVVSGNVIAKALEGPKTLSIAVLNNTIDYTLVNIINRIWTAAVSPAPFEIEVTVPDWIPLEAFYETNNLGRQEISSITLVSGRTYRISGTLQDRSKLFVIGENDTEAPQTITEIGISDKQSPSDFTLSWKEPHDNFGVKGYYIVADGERIDSVKAPLWESANQVNGCLIGYWSVIPYDDAGNTGQPAVLTVDWSSFGTGAPQITADPANQTVTAGNWTTFSISDSGATNATYVWQTDSGNGQWVNLTNDNYHSGVFTNSLSVYGLPAFNTHQYRCIASAGCTPQRDTSLAGLLTVTGELSIAEREEQTLNVYPNPAREWLQVVFDGSEATIEVYEVSGKKVWQGENVSGSCRIDCRALHSGMYSLLVKNKNGRQQRKNFLVR